MEIDPTPQEVPWSVRLDEDEEHGSYDPALVGSYFAAASQAAMALAAYRAPYRGRSTPVNAWWGSFDLAVSLFSGAPADPPSADFIMRNAMDAQEVAAGWWPGDGRYGQAAFYVYAHPAPKEFSGADLGRGGALGGRARRVRARLGLRPRRAGPSWCRGALPPERVRPCLRRLRMGRGARRQRRGSAAADSLTPAAVPRSRARARCNAEGPSTDRMSSSTFDPGPA